MRALFIVFLISCGLNLSAMGNSIDGVDLINFEIEDSLTKKKNLKLKLYPNPVNDRIQIRIIDEEDLDDDEDDEDDEDSDEIELTYGIGNIIGQKKKKGKVKLKSGAAIEVDLDTSHLAKGVYFIYVESSNFIIVQKFIKR